MAREGEGIVERGASTLTLSQLERKVSGYWTQEEEDPFEEALNQQTTSCCSWFPVAMGFAARKSRATTMAAPWSCLVIYESSVFRRFWSLMMVLVLCLTAVCLPSRLAIYDFGMPVAREAPESLEWIEWALEIFFWADLMLCFLFTYKDKYGREIADQRKIVRNYILGLFVVDLIACLPTDVFRSIIEMFLKGKQSKSPLNKLSRIVLMQRSMKLARLARLVRLGRLKNMTRFLDESHIWKGLSALRGFRILKFAVVFLWFVHLCACGWIVCAALHHEAEETWMWRRVVQAEPELRLSNAKPFDQWCHAMYFVLTVFTTVGFGDMSGFTLGEIWYVSFTMVLGVIVNAVILSEIITIVTALDHREKQQQLQKALLMGFSKHVHLDASTTNNLMSWAGSNQFGSDFTRENRDAVRSLIRRNVFPRTLLGQLPDKLFQVPGSSLMQNKFVLACSPIFNGQLPPRFPLLMALSLNSRYYKAGESVYISQDHAFNLFLVMEGVFAAVARPSRKGGLEDLPAYATSYVGSDDVDRQFPLSPYKLYCGGNYFGDYEIFVDGQPRTNSIRCEPRGQSGGGLLLVLSKDELTHLIEDFPHAEVVWRAAAVQRRSYAQRLLQKLTKTQSACELAACTIASQWRLYSEGKLTPTAATSSRSTKFLNFYGASQHKIAKAGALQSSRPASAVSPQSTRSFLASSPMSTKGNVGPVASNVKEDRADKDSRNLTKLEADVRDIKAEVADLRSSMKQVHCLLEDMHAALGCGERSHVTL